jgi:hypothetical protein
MKKFTLFFLAVFLILFSGCLEKEKNQKEIGPENKKEEQAEPRISEESRKEELKTYQSDKFGFSFTYPESKRLFPYGEENGKETILIEDGGIQDGQSIELSVFENSLNNELTGFFWYLSGKEGNLGCKQQESKEIQKLGELKLFSFGPKNDIDSPEGCRDGNENILWAITSDKKYVLRITLSENEEIDEWILDLARSFKLK